MFPRKQVAIYEDSFSAKGSWMASNVFFSVGREGAVLGSLLIYPFDITVYHSQRSREYIPCEQWLLNLAKSGGARIFLLPLP